MLDLHNEDCMPALRMMADNQFDLAIVDPPYGIGDFRHSGARKKHKKIDWNESPPNPEYFKHLCRATKNQIIFGCNYYSQNVSAVGRIIHDKTGGGKKPQLRTLSDCDIASHSFGLNTKIFHYIWQGNMQGTTANWDNTGPDARIHPCQKPIILYKWILENYAKKGDTILETHLGSGSIAIACLDLGYDLTGYEIDKDYFDAMQARIKNHTDQLQLC